MKTIDEVRLTQMTRTAGCAAKIGPGTLNQILGGLPKFQDENLLVGIETSDDAAVYKLTEDLAMIQTLDFFTPVVDDPYTFGQIAAANALSDIYAMGGEPKAALNIVAFPNCLDPRILGDILRGGADKVREAGAVLVGGHSIQDEEPKYGLSVSGLVHPDKILKNCGCHPGDVLILTKQIGSGLINTAVKADMASAEAAQEAIQVMTTLNKYAKEIVVKYPVSACTDVTGFGLLGHLSEMARGSNVEIEVHTADLAFMQEAADYAQMGLVPAGAYKNREFVEQWVDAGTAPEYIQDLLYDPQTSGGLLFAIPEARADRMLEELKNAELGTRISVVGRVTKTSQTPKIHLI